MVANVAPSSQVVKSLDRMGWDVPIVSHWGPAGGRFSELAGPSGAKVHFIQTFSFSGKLSPKGEAVLAALKKKYPEIKSLADVTPAVGIANAYDAMHLTALAIAKAGSTEGPKIREALYAIDKYDGLIKTYAKPFTPANHDALGAGRLHLHVLQGRRDPSADELSRDREHSSAPLRRGSGDPAVPTGHPAVDPARSGTGTLEALPHTPGRERDAA